MAAIVQKLKEKILSKSLSRLLPVVRRFPGLFPVIAMIAILADLSSLPKGHMEGAGDVLSSFMRRQVEVNVYDFKTRRVNVSGSTASVAIKDDTPRESAPSVTKSFSLEGGHYSTYIFWREDLSANPFSAVYGQKEESGEEVRVVCDEEGTLVSKYFDFGAGKDWFPEKEDENERWIAFQTDDLVKLKTIMVDENEVVSGLKLGTPNPHLIAGDSRNVNCDFTSGSQEQLGSIRMVGDKRMKAYFLWMFAGLAFWLFGEKILRMLKEALREGEKPRVRFEWNQDAQ